MLSYNRLSCRDIQRNYRHIINQVKLKGCVILFKHNKPDVVVMCLKEFSLLYRETRNKRLNKTRLTIALNKYVPEIKKLVKNGHFID